MGRISTAASSLMNARERAHALLDEFSDAELEEIVTLLKVRREEVKPEMAELPEAWKMPAGRTPAPNWVAAVHEARRDLDAGL
jgi:hypothetical protein